MAPLSFKCGTPPPPPNPSPLAQGLDPPLESGPCEFLQRNIIVGTLYPFFEKFWIIQLKNYSLPCHVLPGAVAACTVQ